MEKLEELYKELESLDKEREEVFEEFMGMSEKDIPYRKALGWYQKQPIIKRCEHIKREIRKLKEPIYEDIPKYGDHITMDEFVSACVHGFFCDSDGFGFYATKDKMTNVEVYPSDILSVNYRKDFDYVVWFNK